MVTGPAGWQRLLERGGGARRPQTGRSQGEVCLPETGFIYSPSPEPSVPAGGGAESSCPHSLVDDLGQPQCHLGIPTSLSPFLTSASGSDTFKKGSPRPGEKTVCGPKQGFVQRRPDLPDLTPEHKCQPGSAAGPPWTPQVPQLLLPDAAEISNTTSLGLFSLKWGLGPIEPNPQKRVHVTRDRELGQPRPPLARFPQLLEQL